MLDFILLAQVEAVESDWFQSMIDFVASPAGRIGI